LVWLGPLAGGVDGESGEWLVPRRDIVENL
jgi:hypothetical protein